MLEKFESQCQFCLVDLPPMIIVEETTEGTETEIENAIENIAEIAVVHVLNQDQEIVIEVSLSLLNDF